MTSNTVSTVERIRALNGADLSRSAKAFHAGAELKSTGASYEEIRAALISHKDPDIAAWARTKRVANDAAGAAPHL